MLVGSTEMVTIDDVVPSPEVSIVLLAELAVLSELDVAVVLVKISSTVGGSDNGARGVAVEDTYDVKASETCEVARVSEVVPIVLSMLDETPTGLVEVISSVGSCDVVGAEVDMLLLMLIDEAAPLRVNRVVRELASCSGVVDELTC